MLNGLMRCRGKANANTNYPIEFYADELQWLETTSFNQVVAAIRARARGGQCIGSFPPVANQQQQQPAANVVAASPPSASQAGATSAAGPAMGTLEQHLHQQPLQQQLLEQQQQEELQQHNASTIMTRAFVG